MKRFIKVLIVMTLLAAVSSCVNTIGKLEVVGYSIKDIQANSFRNIRGVIGLNISNFGPKLKFTNTVGQLYHGDELVGTLEVDDFETQGHGTYWVDVLGNVKIEERASLLNIMALAKGYKADEYRVVVSSKVKLGIIAKTVVKEKNLADLMKK